MAQKSDTKDVGKMCRRRRHFREGDKASDRVDPSFHCLAFIPLSSLRGCNVAKTFGGVAEGRGISLLRRLLPSPHRCRRHTLHKTHLGIDNETSDLCTDGADMDSSASQSRAEGGGIIINGPLRS